MYEQVPEAVGNALRRLARKMDGKFWANHELRRPGKEAVWKMTKHLTLGDCEQLAEYHARRARRALLRFTGSPSTARTAAEHIFRTRFYREMYHHLLGTEATERDQPFPIAAESDVREWAEAD